MNLIKGLKIKQNFLTLNTVLVTVQLKNNYMHMHWKYLLHHPLQTSAPEVSLHPLILTQANQVCTHLVF